MKTDEALMQVARRRRGVFTVADARAAGVTSDMLTTRVRNGTVVRVEPGVYRYAAAPTTWDQSVAIACIAEGGFAFRRTAGALWRLNGCQPGVVEILTPRWRRRPNRSVRVHETRLLHDDDVTDLDGIPLTTRERTVVDLAAVLPTTRIEQAIDSVGIDMERVWECVERLDNQGRPWVSVVRRLVATRLGRDGVPPNLFEQRLFAILERHGIPLPDPQIEIFRSDGTLIRRVDWLFDRGKVVLECDSFLWHGAWHRRKRDIRVDRELTALGYRVLRFTWEDLDDERRVVADVSAVIHLASA